MGEDQARQDALFVNLILVFKNAALQQMGKLMNPVTGKVERNLEQARFSIDTLDMLKAKTAGNLSKELEQLLDTTLLELRMNYIDEVEREAEEKKPEEKKQEEREGAPSQAKDQEQPARGKQAEQSGEQVQQTADATSEISRKTQDVGTKAEAGKAKKKTSRVRRKQSKKGDDLG